MSKEYTYEEALAIQNKRKAYRKQYYGTHKEQILEYHKKYADEHPEKVAGYRRNFYSNNKEKILEYHNKYRQAHPEKMKEYRKARYDAIKTALKKGPSGSPKEEVIVNEAPSTTTLVTQKRNRRKKETVIEPDKSETNVASNEEE